MKRALKVALAGAAGLILLLGLGLLALPTLVPAERFRPALEAQVSQALGLPVQIGQLRLRPGLEVRLEAGDIRLAGAATESGLEIERLALGLRLWPLLRGQVRVEGVRLEGVSLRLTRNGGDESWALPWDAGRAAAAAEAEPEASSGAAPRQFPVERIEIREARLVFVDRRASGALREGWVLHADADLLIQNDRARAEPLRLRIGKEQIEGKLEWRAGAPPELHGELRSSSLDLDLVLGALSRLGRATQPAAGASATGAPAALSGSLQVRIDSGRVLGLSFSSATAAATLEEGMLRLDSLSVALYGGTVEGRGSITMGREPLPFTLDVKANGVDLEGALPALSPDLGGLLSGRFGGGFELRGRGLQASELSENLRGTLRLDLRDGQLASIGILRRIAELLAVVGGKGIGKETTPYRSITGDFDVRRGRAHTKKLALRSQDLDLDGEGSFGLDATLDFDVEGRFSSAVSAAMVVKTPSLRHLMGKDGRLRMRFRIYGALAEPRVEIDQAFLRQALRRAIQEKSRKKLQDKLKDLFR